MVIRKSHGDSIFADVEQKLVAFPADVDWLNQHEVAIKRFNLAQVPMVFAENLKLKDSWSAQVLTRYL